MSATTGIRPTKGFLMETKRRIQTVERGTEFLKMKRDQLAKELTESLGVLRGRRSLLLENLSEAYRALTAAYLSLGPIEVQSQAKSIKNTLELEVLPRSIMGVVYPSVQLQGHPEVAAELDITLAHAAEKVFQIIEEIIRLAEFEERVERIASELGATSRKVNALENMVIPDMRYIIKFIEDKLDEEAMEELVRMKLIGGAKKS
ncbi:MAG TPA: V-type ATP synthase subunit D [Candidatus Bathyarchaeota archaeon]|nr:V-type ATP synthase subunit D [Candidatus Bathyarchaeota archaeon]